MLSHDPDTREARTLSIDDAAELYGCSSKTIRRYIAEGRLPAYRLGSRMIRVREADVMALLRPIPSSAAS